MDNDIDIYEFEWWMIFSVILIIIVLSISLIVAAFYLQQISTNWRIEFILFFGMLILTGSIIGLWTIYFVPRLIKFKQNNIHVVFPSGQEKVLPYNAISRIIIIDQVTKRGQVFTKSFSRFRIRVYFFDNAIKIMFNPDRMIDFPAVLEHIKSKGLGSIIEHK